MLGLHWQFFAGNLWEPSERHDPHGDIIDDSICNKNPPNLKIIDTEGFCLWISVQFVLLITVLNGYSFLTSEKGQFPRWRPRWLPGSYNSYLSITTCCFCLHTCTCRCILQLLVVIKLVCPRNESASFQLPMCITKIPNGFMLSSEHPVVGTYHVRSMLHFQSHNPHYESGATRVARDSDMVLTWRQPWRWTLSLHIWSTCQLGIVRKVMGRTTSSMWKNWACRHCLIRHQMIRTAG